MKMLFKNIILLSVDVQYKTQSNSTPHTLTFSSDSMQQWSPMAPPTISSYSSMWWSWLHAWVHFSWEGLCNWISANVGMMGHSTSPKWPTTALAIGANRTWQPHGDSASVGSIFIPSFIHSHRLPRACLQPASWYVYYFTAQMRSLRFAEGC